MKNTLIINLFSQPNIDIKIISGYITAQLRIMGIKTECVELCTLRMNDDKIFKCPLYLVGKQSFEINKLYGDIDVIINEYPILNFISSIEREYLDMSIVEDFISYGVNNLNIYLNGTDENQEYKNNMLNIFNKYFLQINSEFTYIDFDASMSGCENIVKLITSILNYMSNEKTVDGQSDRN